MYDIEIIEILKKKVSVDANSGDLALEKIKSEYAQGKYVLDADDFCEVNFEVAK